MAVYQFKLPDVGEGMHEGELVKWHIKAGDSVEEDQIILDIQNDKSVVELPSPITGKVSEISVAEGTVATVGQVLATFEVAEGKGSPEEASAAKTTSNAQAEPAKEAAKESATESAKEESAKIASAKKTASPETVKEAQFSADAVHQGGTTDQTDQTEQPEQQEQQKKSDQPNSDLSKILATPSVRRLAREHNVALGQLKGSGRSGQITKEDVLSAKGGDASGAEKSAKPEVNTAGESKEGNSPKLSNPSPAKGSAAVPIGGRTEERVAFKGIRKIIANAMVKSVYTAPHVTLMDEVEVSQLIEFREMAKPMAEQKGVKLTYLPFIVKALTAAAKQFPIINAAIDEDKDEIVYKKYYNIGIATDTDNGLIVPVVADANYKSLFEIAAEIKDLAARGREGKLALSEMKGSTITITNIGSAGGMFFTPVINFPESAILGTGRITQKPVVKDGQIVIGHVMALSLSFDHRIIDGATAQHAMNYIKQLLENPQLLLLEG